MIPVAEDHDLYVIEDAIEVHGAERAGIGVRGTFDEEKAKRKGFYYKRS